MYCIQQISQHHCFPACLVSFFSDLQLPLTQSEIVNRCPEAFNKGTEIEGGVEPSLLHKVANEFNIEIIRVQPNITINKHESLFLFVHWKGDSTQNHCLRFCYKNSKFTYFMNPSSGKIEHELSNILSSWVRLPLLIRKN
ncbi:MAG: hypothetical protein KAU41_12710 [Deltaproteobacteria bacterium]|nr:hypothetical protein [Deltaproteobacteria bacterium]